MKKDKRIIRINLEEDGGGADYKHNANSIRETDYKQFISKEEKDKISQNAEDILALKREEKAINEISDIFINGVPDVDAANVFWIEEIGGAR